MIIDNINCIFTFGKYKGESLKKVALINPSYLEWICKEVENVIINDEIIDQLSDYCIYEFLRDPQAYFNEEGNFVLCSSQHIKHRGKEILIGDTSVESRINRLVNNVQLPPNYFPLPFSRKLFDGEFCKKQLKLRIPKQNEDSGNNYEDRKTYNNYNGHYVQDVEGWSDQSIDDAFGGEPDAYWNID